MCAEDRFAPLAALLRNNQHQSRKLLRSYLEAVNYLLRKYASDKANAEFDGAILRYMQTANMTFQQHADNLIAKSRTFADFYDEGAPNDVFIKGAEQ